MRINLSNETRVKNQIEDTLRQMCFGNSREWSENMVNKIFKTGVIEDSCIIDHIDVDIDVDKDIIVSALMEIVYENSEYEEGD